MPDTAGGIFALFNMQWNLKRSVENKGDPDTGTVEPWLQSNLAQLSSALGLPANSFQTVSIPASTQEKFGVEYVPDALDQEAAEEAEEQGMAEVEAELVEEDEALLAAAALDAMRFLGRQDCNHPEQYPASSCSAAHDTHPHHRCIAHPEVGETAITLSSILHPHALLHMIRKELIGCSSADDGPPAASSRRPRSEAQAPVQQAEALAGPSAPNGAPPLQQARRRLPASLRPTRMPPPTAACRTQGMS